MKLDKQCWPEMDHSRWIEDNGTPDLVSVIVPTFNREVYIIEALDSVYRQTYRPIELIIVDDGSSDSTESLINNWKSARELEDFSVKLFRQDNAGAPVARNRGVRESHGAYIQFLDSDDSLGSEKLRLQVGILQADPNAGMVYASTNWQGTREESWYKNEEFSREQSLRFCLSGDCGFFNTISPLFRRQVVEELGPWDESLPCFQDIDYGMRFFSREYSYSFCPEAVSYVRKPDSRQQVAESASEASNARKAIDARWKILQKAATILPREFLLEPSNREYYARCLFSLMRWKIRARYLAELPTVLEHCQGMAEGTTYKRSTSLFCTLQAVIGWSLGMMVYNVLELIYTKLRK